MYRAFNFRSDRLRTKRTKFGPDENFPLYSIRVTVQCTFGSYNCKNVYRTGIPLANETIIL